MLRLFVALIEHHIANALRVAEDGNPVWLALVEVQLGGMPLVGPGADHRQFKVLLLFCVVEIDLETCENVFNVCVLQSND
jgi:hypothetical protein